jgi:O-succinylbenzoic acid--CoA ligase
MTSPIKPPTDASARAAEPLVCPETPAEVRRALTSALAGGPAVAPLPRDPREREQALAVLQPDLPLIETDVAAVVATSGSTGRPKGVVLSRSAVMAAAQAAHERLGGPGSWILALPAHYVAGLMVLARAEVARTDVTVADPSLLDLEQAAATLSGRRYLSLVPTQLLRACDDPRTGRILAALDGVLVGGSAVDPALLDRARALGIPVVTSYGMCETCGGCVYDGVPLSGVSVELDPAGRISLRGPMVFSGYRLDPELTATSLRKRTFRTSDHGQWVGGRLRVTGRLDDVVISGGRNIDLAELERLARSAGHSEVAMIGVPDQEWGVTVVAVSTGSESLADLRSRLAADLPDYALPKRLIQVPRLPFTAAGKIDRPRLIRELSS